MKHTNIVSALVTLLWSAMLLSPVPGRAADHICPTLARDLHLIKVYYENPEDKNARRMAAFGLPVDLDPVLPVFLHFEEAPDPTRLMLLGSMTEEVHPHTWLPPVGAHRTGFLLAKIRSSQVELLLQSGLVARVTAAYRKLEKLNDNAAMETGAAVAHEQVPPLRGQDVRLAVLDSGFQLDFPDLPEPVAAMDYADYPDTNDNVTDQLSGHGTHVAGSAFGSGGLSNGRWMGMAPDCEPIYFKIGDDSTTNASSAAVVGAVRGAATWADADIATMSYGGFDGFNDGSSEEDQAVDWAVGQGMTVLMSAGNSAGSRIRYNGTVGPGGISEPIQVLSMSAPEHSMWELYVSWYDGPDTSEHVALSAIITLGEEEYAYDVIGPVSSPRGTEVIQYIPEDELPTDSVSFFVRIINDSDVLQDYHLVIVSSNFNLRFQEFSRSYSVALPSTADSCISVGAFISRFEWVDYLGEPHNSGGQIGEIARFSSIGPRIDGVIKPDICAPGRQVISCRNQDIIELGGPHGLDYRIVSNDGNVGEPADYIALEGTSMSSPVAAGCAALILQAYPDWSPAELRHQIYWTARVDTFTMEVPNTTWGWGKIDVVSALSIGEKGGDATQPDDFGILALWPNPFNPAFNLSYRVVIPGEVRLQMFDLNGRKITELTRNVAASGVYTMSVNSIDWALPSGAYIIGVSSGGGYDQRTALLVK